MTIESFPAYTYAYSRQGPAIEISNEVQWVPFEEETVGTSLCGLPSNNVIATMILDLTAKRITAGVRRHKSHIIQAVCRRIRSNHQRTGSPVSWRISVDNAVRRVFAELVNRKLIRYRPYQPLELVDYKQFFCPTLIDNARNGLPDLDGTTVLNDIQEIHIDPEPTPTLID